MVAFTNQVGTESQEHVHGYRSVLVPQVLVYFVVQLKSGFALFWLVYLCTLSIGCAPQRCDLHVLCPARRSRAPCR